MLTALSLPDGRRLDVRISGPSDGLPVLFLHGTPGAGTTFRDFERTAHERGLRFVTMSRPGYGGSSRQAGRQVVDAVADAGAALAETGWDQCLVVGWSGGGPHALACTARLEGCLAGLILAGVAPYEAEGLEWMAGMGEDNVDEFDAALVGEDALRRYLIDQRAHLKDVTPEGIVTSLTSILPAVDRAVLTTEFGEDMATSFREALRPGVDGWLDDDLAFVAPWGFSLDEIAVPTTICQGGVDLMVPAAHGAWLAEHIPGAAAHLPADQGHLSVTLGLFGPALDELLARTR